MRCKFHRTCKKYESESCNPSCYPYVMLHGIDGNGGFMGTTNVPKRYRELLIEDLANAQSSENQKMYDKLTRYAGDVINLVNERHIGLYLYGGTGTGKTTAAIVILNEFLLARVRQHLMGTELIKNNPVLFLSLAEFQNIYNGMFRGSSDVQQQNADEYYKLKDKLKNVELLLLDDVATRETSEGFRNELFEVVDHRSAERLTTFFTSNVSIEELPLLVGDRIASRIDGMTSKINLKGKDFRKGGNF